MARKRIGELLLERGVITRDQLEAGLAHHRATQQRLGVALIEKGFVSEAQLAKVLGEALQIAEVDLRSITPEWSAIHMLRARFCEANDLFPFAIEAAKGRKQLFVAMSDPLNLSAIEEIEFTTGLKVVVRIAPLSAIRAAILRYYHKVNPDDSGRMTVVQPGGAAVPVGHGATASAEEAVVVGEEISERTSLAELIQRREAQQRARRATAPKTKAGSVADDLNYLFGLTDDTERVEKLERQFWALMRLMARKGLLTKEEFTRELDDDDD